MGPLLLPQAGEDEVTGRENYFARLQSIPGKRVALIVIDDAFGESCHEYRLLLLPPNEPRIRLLLLISAAVSPFDNRETVPLIKCNSTRVPLEST